jgi:hypothetical protein
MQNFEDFKKSRLTMDPTSRNLTDHQWEQSYAAFQISQQRASGGSSKRKGEGGSSRGSGRRRHSTKQASKGMHAPTALSKTGFLIREVRKETAYSELRFLVNILSYLLMALIVGNALFQVVVFTSMLAGVSVLLTAGLQIVIVVLAKLLVQVLIDIPDVLLYRHSQGDTEDDV